MAVLLQLTCVFLTITILQNIIQPNSVESLIIAPVVQPPPEFYTLASTHAAMSAGRFQGQGYRFVRRWYRWCWNATSQKYRSIDGTCNNVRNLGAAFTAVPRLLPPEYADGVDAPRQFGKDGLPLPSARNVSLHLHPCEAEYTCNSLMVMQWGQWVIHDLSAIPISTGPNGAIQCCGDKGEAPPFINQRNCFPIEIPTDDYDFNFRCMEFVRSMALTNEFGITEKPRTQINIVTSFIDASQIYGSLPTQERNLRDLVNNTNPLCILKTFGHSALPQSPVQNCVLRPNTSDYCQLAGDIRVNEQPGLGVMHTLFVREHNRIAQEFSRLLSNASEERIFQLTRKVVAAYQQIINYNEYLPEVLGRDAYVKKLVSKRGRTAYNPDVDPSILNEFSTAAFRFGHSTIPEALSFFDRMTKLRYLLHRPTECLEHYDQVLAGLIGVVDKPYRQALKKVDRNFVHEVSKFLFEAKNPNRTGLDLISLNIQRGRDHGLAPYVKYRAYCGLSPVKDFNDTHVLGPHVRDLQKVYRSIDDIDLFTGLLYEPSVGHSAIGPTLKCLLGIQFYRTKYGDRFFFDTEDESIGFNDEQLDALRNTSLAKIICHNSALKEVPLNVFRLPSTNNPLYSCEQLRTESLDLTLFV
ncbi:peroxidase-like [Biomphalaria glabrata]|uniref:Peroxidase-like n=1 Tax=Biomphalaria glabrata TaxID=6526 RepID=A0A9W3A9P4_BIOGL|nr:peroxidase-like [Biomphalaria glabrata]